MLEPYVILLFIKTLLMLSQRNTKKEAKYIQNTSQKQREEKKMDPQSQLTRHDQAENPMRIHHPEEEEHHEKGASKVLKKVKEKAKKIKNSITKHGHGHEHDEDVEEEYEPEVHGAPIYDSVAVRGGETNVPSPEEIVPPGTKVFPVVSSDYTKPVEPEALYQHEVVSHPRRMLDTSEKEVKRDEASYPLRVFDMSEREESREAHHMPVSLLSATEDVTRTFAPGEDEYLGGQRKVNIETPTMLKEDPAGPGGGSDYPNYESKVTDPTKGGGGEAGVPGIVESLGRMKVTDESPRRKSGRDFERDLPTRSHESGLGPTTGHGYDERSQFSTGYGSELSPGIGKDAPTGLGSASLAGLGEGSPTQGYDEGMDVKVEGGLGKEEPTGTRDQFSPKERDETQRQKPSRYTDKFASTTSVLTDKAIAAKNAVASKLGYSGEQEENPGSTTGVGPNVASTVAEKLTPVYEKVKDTGSSLMTKLPFSGGVETQQGADKGLSTGGYLAEKLKPGEEDKALSQVIAEKLHLGGGEKKITEVEVTVEKIPSDQIPEEIKHSEEGMVGKLKGAVTSWLGTTEVKALDSGDESSQSLGSTVGTKGFSDSAASLSTQGGLQGSGN